MLDFLIAIATSKPGLLVEGVVIGVIFDEFLTTKFAWVRQEGRDALGELKAKLKGE